MEGIVTTTVRPWDLELVSTAVVRIRNTIAASRTLVGIRVLVVVVTILAGVSRIVRVMDKVRRNTTASQHCQTTQKQNRKDAPNKTFVVQLFNGFKIDSVHHKFSIG